MRDYQPTKNNQYRLPKTLYKRVLATVRDYDRMLLERESILLASPAPPDGLPRGCKTSDPTADKAVKLDAIDRCLHAVDQALIQVPEEYREAIMQKILTDAWPIKCVVGKNLCGYWKSRFLYHVARNMNLV